MRTTGRTSDGRRFACVFAWRWLFLVMFVLIAMAFPLAAQDADDIVAEMQSGAEETADDAQTGGATVLNKRHAAFFTIGPTLLVNTDSSKKSAPSPIMFSIGVGGDLFQDKAVGFVPRLSLFYNYYLWDGEAARPAEIENRTALVIFALLDFDAVKTWRRGAHTMQLGGGVSVLARYGILAGGVSSSDTGGTATSTAGDDVSSINTYVWQDMRFLYPNAMFTWLHDLPNGWRAGATAYVYVPLGSLMNGDGADAMLVSVALRVEL